MSELMSQVARSVDAPRALAPVLPQLFRGLDALGGMPRATARLAIDAGAGPRSRILDLGCGKGGTAVELAARSGCRVLGIDGCPAFIDAARELAARRGVAARCEFRIGDFRKPPAGRFDGALLLNILSVEEAARLARRVTRPGGFYLIDDAVRGPGRLPRGVVVLERDEAREVITRSGEEILEEYLPSAARVRSLNARLYRVISENARAVASEFPRLRPALREFLLRQRTANRQLGGPVRPALWVVRRANPGRARP